MALLAEKGDTRISALTEGPRGLPTGAISFRLTTRGYPCLTWVSLVGEKTKLPKLP